MSKELKALEELFGIAAYCNENMGWMNETQLEKYDKKCENMKKIIEQALIQKAKQTKILDILKKKEVDIGWLENCKSLYNFNSITDYQLTQEEYDLLKEWLNGTK